MPELPEVETIARGLASRVTGDVIESVWLGSKPEPLKSTAAEIAATLESRRIVAVRRVGSILCLIWSLAVWRGRPFDKLRAGSRPRRGVIESAIRGDLKLRWTRVSAPHGQPHNRPLSGSFTWG